jgi:nucleoside-diphosphate-sugar epimerase
MKLLFLGGTGNISSACVERALERGHDVTLLNRGRTASPFGARVGHVAGDRSDPAALQRAAEGTLYDAVVDFVAFSPEDVEAAITAFAGRTGQYVFISSTSVYRKPPPRYPITEETPLENPWWDYARRKIACEERLLRAHRADAFPATIVRPSYTYGPTWIPTGFGRDYTLVDRMRRARPVVSQGDGTALWVMTAASDLAVGLVGLLGHPKAVGEAVHITSDEVLTWDEIYRTIGRAAGCEPEIVHVPSDTIVAHIPERAGSLLGDKAWSAFFDNGKIKRLVPEFGAKVRFAEGVARSIAWFDANPARRVVNEVVDGAIERIIAAQRRAMEAGP